MIARTHPLVLVRRMVRRSSRIPLHVPRVNLSRWIVLAGLGLASLAFYAIGMIGPYNLYALDLHPLTDIAKLTRDRPVAQAEFVLTFVGLFSLYYLAWRACRPATPTGDQAKTEPSDQVSLRPSKAPPQRYMWAALLVSLLAINLGMLWLYPIGAADVFDNIIRGRMTDRYGLNPFFDSPRSIQQDPFFAYSAWRDWPSAYGPAWELMAAGLSRLPGDDPLSNILVFKGFGLAAYAGSIGLIAIFLRRRAPERALQGVCLFGWNPLVVYETAGNGHNDIVMVFFILLGFFALEHKRWVASAAALTVGALVKFIPLLLIPIAAIVGIRATRGKRDRGLLVLKMGAVCAGLTALVVFPFWGKGDLFGIQRRSRLFSTSIPAMVETRLEAPLGVRQSQRTVSVSAAALTGLMVLAQTRRVWRERPHAEGAGALDEWLVPVRAATVILIFYLVATCLWFQSWYVLWPLALAALLPEGELGRTAVLLSYVAAWKTIVFSFLLVPDPPLPSRLWRETRLAPATLGIVWLYAAYVLARPRLARLRWAWRRKRA